VDDGQLASLHGCYKIIESIQKKVADAQRLN